MAKSLTRIKCENFAVRAINMQKHLQAVHNEFKYSDQVGRSASSIAANFAEALFAQTDADYIAKIRIALKEASETRSWLNLLYKTNYITETEYKSMYSDCDEVVRLLLFKEKQVLSRYSQKSKNDRTKG